MGERERRDSQKVLDGKPILDIKRWRLLDYVLYPYRAWKEKKRQEEIKRKLLAQAIAASPSNIQNPPISRTITEDLALEDGKQIVDKDSWLYGIMTEDDTKNKGE